MKKKVIIFSCNGGGGHISAAKAIETYLNEHDITIIDAVGKLFAPLDPIYWFSLKKYTGQDVYNFLLQRNKKQFVSVLYTIGLFFIDLNQYLMRVILRRYLKRERPDLLISVIPLVNGFIADIAKELAIPFILVPTDFDLSTFVRSLQPPYHQQFRLAYSFDYQDIKQTFAQAQIPNSLIRSTGFPIRVSFFEKKELNFIKATYGVAPDKLVVMVVMGAAGSCAIINYLQEIIKINYSFHIVLCIGRNFGLRYTLQQLLLPPTITITVIDASVSICDIMAIADICITKPGSVTFAEALYMNIPVLLDCTSTVLAWEKFNLLLVKKYQLGDLIHNERDITSILSRYIVDNHFRNKIKQNILNLQKKRCSNELILLVNELLGNELAAVSYTASQLPELYKQNRTLYDESIQ